MKTLFSALWPMVALMASGLLINWVSPAPRSHVTITDWQAWAAMLATFGASFLVSRGDLIETGHRTALFFCGFLVARLLFW